MRDEYVNAFYGLVKETRSYTGVNLPEHLEAYIVMLLASRIRKNEYLPKNTFAEEYLKLKRPATLDAKELGDTCLFVTGVFPTYGKKYGLNRTYYQDIGIGSYGLMSESLNADLFEELSNHFVLLSDFIEVTVNRSGSKTIELFNSL